MTTTIRKGLIGKNDLKFYTAASPTFSRTTSTGGSTIVTAVAATHIPIVQSGATTYYSASNVQRATSEIISRYFAMGHSIATYSQGARVGHHTNVFGFKNAAAATSIQAAASNQYRIDGTARIVIPDGTYTAATPINLPRKVWVIGNGRGTIVRASSTIQTSRVFSIAGTVGATQSALLANATIGTQVVPVTDGTKFSAGNWIILRDSKNVELQEIRSISGNDLTVNGVLRHTYRSAATIANASLVYPAEIHMDNFDIQLSSATQGIGVAATYAVRSFFGPNLRIKGYARAAVKLTTSEDNTINPDILGPSSVAAGKGYGVHLTSGSSDNRLGGARNGSTKDVSDGTGSKNWFWGPIFRGPSAASGISDPIAFWYRTRKPELMSLTYGSTVAVGCDAGTNNPAEAYINGSVYRNTGRIICDLSRTKTPSTATVGGMDRGPATATGAFYIYAVPSQNPSATRQFDLVASAGDPSSGPTASSTWPVWSYLGAVNTGATVRLIPFSQSGDDFKTRIQLFASSVSGTRAQATWKSLTNNLIPVSTKKLNMILHVEQPAAAQIQGYSMYVTDDSVTNESTFGTSTNPHTHLYLFVNTQTITTVRQFKQTNGYVPISSARRFKYKNSFPVGGATLNVKFYFTGYRLDRSGYK